jgi:hypothetical protein
VRAAVSYLTVRLAGGTVLTLHPVSVYGTRYVAFAVPLHVPISKITAYSARGELASAIPFNGPDGSPTVGLWLRPGQTGPAPRYPGDRLREDGRPRLVRYGVPGTAGQVPGDPRWRQHQQGCNPVSSPQGTMVLGSASGSPGLVYGSASARVEHVVITLAAAGPSGPGNPGG